MSVDLLNSFELLSLSSFAEKVGLATKEEAFSFFQTHNVATSNKRYGETTKCTELRDLEIDEFSLDTPYLLKTLSTWLNNSNSVYESQNAKLHKQVFTALHHPGTENSLMLKEAFCVGSCVEIDLVRSSRIGFVVGHSKEHPSTLFGSSSPEKLSGKMLKVAYYDGSYEPTYIDVNIEHVKPSSDGVQMSLRQAEEFKSVIDNNRKLRAEASEKERIKAQIAENDNAEKLSKLIPTWAKSALIATKEEYDHKSSDPMSDYDQCKTTSKVILGFSKHTRNLFPEMRKAAENYAETKFLANTDNGFEKREVYSMGKGVYLSEKDGWSRGWYIRKVKFYQTNNMDIALKDIGECNLSPLIRDETENKKVQAITQNVEMKFNEAKQGVELYFKEKPSDEILGQLNANKFRYHRKKIMWYAKNTEENLKVANQIVSTLVKDNEATPMSFSDLFDI